MLSKDYSQRLNVYKFENNLTFKELGAILGVSKTVARDIVKGNRQFVSLDTAKKIFNLLDKEVESC